jgi:2-aminomuconate deaminase
VKTKVFSESAPPPVGPYPHARRVGDFIFVSGMGPRQAGRLEIPGVHQDVHGRVISYDIEAQTRATIENIARVLKDAGSSLKDVVDVQVFLTHMQADFQKFNKVYGEYFTEIGPTRTTVEVLSLPTPIAVELKVIAHQRAASAPAKKTATKSVKKARKQK